MVKALILDPLNKESRIVNLNRWDDYCVDGYYEEIDVRRGYADSKRTKFVKRRVRCYASVEGDIPNPWSNIVNVLRGIYRPLFGTIILTCEDENNGEDGDVDPYLIDLFSLYESTGHSDTFIDALYQFNELSSGIPLFI